MKNMVPLFLRNLRKLVDNPVYDELISWNKNGDHFIIWDCIKFITKFLVKYFNCKKFNRFRLILNRYGFKRKSRHCNVHRRSMEFYHPYFVKDKENLMRRIKQVPARNGNDKFVDSVSENFLSNQDDPEKSISEKSIILETVRPSQYISYCDLPVLFFLKKLKDILNCTHDNGLMIWNEDEKNLIITKPKVFAETLMKNYFQIDNLTQFTRQLSIYGFLKQPGQCQIDDDSSIVFHYSSERKTIDQGNLLNEKEIPDVSNEWSQSRNDDNIIVIFHSDEESMDDDNDEPVILEDISVNSSSQNENRVVEEKIAGAKTSSQDSANTTVSTENGINFNVYQNEDHECILPDLNSECVGVNSEHVSPISCNDVPLEYIKMESLPISTNPDDFGYSGSEENRIASLTNSSSSQGKPVSDASPILAVGNCPDLLGSKSISQVKNNVMVASKIKYFDNDETENSTSSSKQESNPILKKLLLQENDVQAAKRLHTSGGAMMDLTSSGTLGTENSGRNLLETACKNFSQQYENVMCKENSSVMSNSDFTEWNSSSSFVQPIQNNSWLKIIDIRNETKSSFMKDNSVEEFCQDDQNTRSDNTVAMVVDSPPDTQGTQSSNGIFFWKDNPTNEPDSHQLLLEKAVDTETSQSSEDQSNEISESIANLDEANKNVSSTSNLPFDSVFKLLELTSINWSKLDGNQEDQTKAQCQTHKCSYISPNTSKNKDDDQILGTFSTDCISSPSCSSSKERDEVSSSTSYTTFPSVNLSDVKNEIATTSSEISGISVQEFEELHKSLPSICDEEAFNNLSSMNDKESCESSSLSQQKAFENKSVASYISSITQKESVIENMLTGIQNENELFWKEFLDLTKMWGAHRRLEQISASSRKVPFLVDSSPQEIIDDMKSIEVDQGTLVKLLTDFKEVKERVWVKLMKLGETFVKPSRAQIRTKLL